MHNLRNLLINFYDHRKAQVSSGVIPLKEIIARIKLFNVDQPKSERLGYTFNTNTRYGRLENDVTNFTGLMFVDIDKIIPGKTSAVKDVFKRLPYTVGCWRSSSGKNIHALIRIPVCYSKEEYHLRFSGLGNLIEPYLVGKVKDPEPGERRHRLFDDTAKDLTRLAFESSDPNVYYNFSAEVFEDMASPKIEPTYEREVKKNLNPEAEKEILFRVINEKFDEVNTDGFGQVRSLSAWFGARIAENNIDPGDAEKVLLNAVESNFYLNSKESSGTMKTYITTAKKSFNYGLNN